MTRKKYFGIFGGAILVLVFIIVITLIYAVFTGQLNITGTSTARQSNWDIHFENLSSVTTTGSAKVLTDPSLESPTSIEDYDVTVTSPGDTISFTFKVVNDGNYDASISSVSVGTPQCTGTDSTSNSNVCGKLSYTLTYEGGASVQTGDLLYANDHVIMKVTLTYADFNDSSLLPTADVSISGLGITINYEQSGSALVKDNGEVLHYQMYHQGEKITLNNEDYYVIANSGADKDYVVALKEEPLTILDINQYGAGHINKYTNYYVTPNQVREVNGFGGVAYYTSESCSYLNDVEELQGCSNSYNISDVKYIVDNWASAVFDNQILKEVDGYRVRLITVSEYNNIPRTQSWRVLNPHYSSLYWTMTPVDNQNSQVYAVRNSSAEISSYGINKQYYPVFIRPVINVYKSALETGNNE